MGFGIANDYLQEVAFIVAIVGTALAISALVLRFVATKRITRKLGWEDWFAVLATFFLTAYVAPFLYLLVTFNGRISTDLTKKDYVNMTKAGYVMAAQFCMQQLFAKLSLLFLYYRLYWVNRSFVICIYVLGTAQVCWSIATYMIHYFECTPPQKLWKPELPGHCINSPAFLAGGETPNSLMDFALVGMAIWMVQSLGIKTSMKLKLAILFAIGGLAGTLGFVKIGEGFTPMNTEKVELLDPIWATVQQTCSVICCCAPLYKSLIPELSILEKLQSFMNQMFGRGSRSEKQRNSEEAEMSAPPVEGVWKKPDTWIHVNESSIREPSLTEISPHVHVGKREDV